MERINPQTFKAMLAAGTVQEITVVSLGDGFNVLIKIGKIKSPLATFRGNVRTFKNIQTVLSYLHDVGVTRFDVDIRDYVPKA
jgi:hypothetical protein